VEDMNSNHQTPSTNNQIMTNNKTQNSKHKFDLEDRTLKFGKRIIRLCRALPRDAVNRRLSDQLLRAGTSVGANYREANETETKRDFRHKIGISRKEAKETNYWLKLVIEANPQFEGEIQPLLGESIELVKIFASIVEKSR